MLELAELMPDCWLEVLCILMALRPTNSIKVFRGPRANAELVPKFHVALHASHAALPMVTLKFRPNVGLNFVPMQPFQIQLQ
jgi:hypothetical protein